MLQLHFAKSFVHLARRILRPAHLVVLITDENGIDIFFTIFKIESV
jgi:hypothetical protein